MQLIGNTPEEKRRYKQALLAARNDPGFDIDNFNKQWIAAAAPVTAPYRPADTPGDKMPADDPRPASMASYAPAMPAADPVSDSAAGLPKIPGTQYPREDSDKSEKLRQIAADINGVMQAYKLENNIPDFSKERAGAIKFRAALMYIYREIVKPSGILKRAPYKQVQINGGPYSNFNAYDFDALNAFITICLNLCTREGLIFNRTYFMDITGTGDTFLLEKYGNDNALTSASLRIRENVLRHEFNSSLAAAYGSEIGNIRNLNENESRARSDAPTAPASVAAADLRRLPG